MNVKPRYKLGQKVIIVDNGYKFGTGWLKRDIPVEDVAEIEKLLTEE